MEWMIVFIISIKYWIYYQKFGSNNRPSHILKGFSNERPSGYVSCPIEEAIPTNRRQQLKTMREGKRER